MEDSKKSSSCKCSDCGCSMSECTCSDMKKRSSGAESGSSLNTERDKIRKKPAQVEEESNGDLDEDEYEEEEDDNEPLEVDDTRSRSGSKVNKGNISHKVTSQERIEGEPYFTEK